MLRIHRQRLPRASSLIRQATVCKLPVQQEALHVDTERQGNYINIHMPKTERDKVVQIAQVVEWPIPESKYRCSDVHAEFWKD